MAGRSSGTAWYRVAQKGALQAETDQDGAQARGHPIGPHRPLSETNRTLHPRT